MTVDTCRSRFPAPDRSKTRRTPDGSIVRVVHYPPTATQAGYAAFAGWWDVIVDGRTVHRAWDLPDGQATLDLDHTVSTLEAAAAGKRQRAISLVDEAAVSDEQAAILRQVTAALTGVL